jgi:hypothetical protein
LAEVLINLEREGAAATGRALNRLSPLSRGSTICATQVRVPLITGMPEQTRAWIGICATMWSRRGMETPACRWRQSVEPGPQTLKAASPLARRLLVTHFF